MDEDSVSSLELVNRGSDPACLVTPFLEPLFWRAERLGVRSAWWQHVPFAHWVVCAARPRLLVELGTHAGVSYSAFCQAVARSGLDTRCYAVDTWRSDPRAGLCREEVFEEFSRFHDEHYSAFSTLLRTTFDEALAQFADAAVDLLHIDGLHTYEAVRHDFESWTPKLSQRAPVGFLLHDTNVREEDFGVWRLWSELCDQYPHFEFLHGHGLGVLAVGNDVDPALLSLCRLPRSSVAMLRNRFAALGERYSQLEQAIALAGQASQERAEIEATARAATTRAEQAEANAREAVARAEQAGANAREAQARAEQAEQIRREAEARADEWAARARESDRAREHITRRITAARRDAHDANARAQKAEAKAVRAAAMTPGLVAQAELMRTERDQASRELEALLASTAWQVTAPLRVAGSKLPWRLRRVLRSALELAWWSVTLKLPRKLRARRAASAVQRSPAATPPLER